MPIRRCLVPNCFSRYNSEDGQKLGDLEKISLFALPKNPALRDKWETAVLNKCGQISQGARHVCSRHFEGDQIETHYEIRMRDVRLRKGAIPSVFPDCSRIPSNTSPEQRVLISEDSDASNDSSTLLKEAIAASERSVAVSEHNASVSEQSPQEQSVQTDMKLPNDSWCSTTLSGRGIIFMELSPDLTSVVRRVVVYENLDVKVWLNEIPVQIEHFTKLSCTEKIPCLLEIVSSMELSSSHQSIDLSQSHVDPHPGENVGPEPFVGSMTDADWLASPVDTFDEREAPSIKAVRGAASCKKKSSRRRMARLRMLKAVRKQQLENYNKVERIEREIDPISDEEEKYFKPLVKLEVIESELEPDTSSWHRPSPMESFQPIAFPSAVLGAVFEPEVKQEKAVAKPGNDR